MKRILPLIALLSLSLGLSAQEVRISDFKASGTGPAGVVLDFDGHPCAILRMETGLSGWSFDAGLAGIVDVVPGKDWVDVYLSASARSITVARDGARPLREWIFPEQLAEGRTYSMRLEVKVAQAPRHTAPVQNVSRPEAHASVPITTFPASGLRQAPSAGRVVKPRYPDYSLNALDTDQPRGFSRNFLDMYAGLVQYKDSDYVDELFVGFRYTWLRDRIGPYVSAAISTDLCGAFFAGAALRVFSEEHSDTDIHLYGGAGLVYGCALAGEAGLRFAWKSESTVSHWDIGVGCQFWQGAVVPTVEVGLCIWGIPLLVCLGLGACALGG